MILLDSSVWIDHLRSADPAVAALLDGGEVLSHPFVVGELAMGNYRQRAVILNTIRDLPQAVLARNDEVRAFVERHTLFGIGIGYIDAHLLAAAMLTPAARLWTRDRRLRTAAERLGVAAERDR